MISDVVVAFCFDDHPSIPGRIVSKSDPCIFQLPKYPQLGPWSRVSSFQIASRYHLDRGRRPPTGNGPDWILLALYGDSGVIEYGFRNLEVGDGPSLVRVPTLVMMQGNERALGETRTGRGHLGGGRTPKLATRDWRDVYDTLITGQDSFGAASRYDFRELLSDQGEELRDQGASCLLLLSENSNSRLLVTDLDQDSKDLEWFLSLIASENTRTRHLPSSLGPRLTTTSLALIYEALSAAHLRPFPSRIPEKTRTYRERIIRRVAADLHLASWAVCPAIPKTITAPSHEASQSPEATEAPLLSSQLPSSLPALSSSQVTPPNEDPVVLCLKRYAPIWPRSVISEPHIASIPELQSILRHLPESADSNPADYQWRRVEETIAEENEEREALELAERDPRAARKVERARTARLRRETARLEQELALSQRHMAPTVLSSQVPNYEVKMPDRSISSPHRQGGMERWGSQMESSQPEPSSMVFSQASTVGFSQSPGGSQATGQGLSTTKPKAKKRTAGF